MMVIELPPERQEVRSGRGARQGVSFCPPGRVREN